MFDSDWPEFHDEPLFLVVEGDDGLPRNITLPPGTFEDDMRILCELGVVEAVEVEV
jgi:hypothetical protein